MAQLLMHRSTDIIGKVALMALFVLFVLLLFLAAKNGANGQEPVTYAESRGCTHHHPSRVGYRVAGKILRSPAPLTSKRWKAVHHYAVCQTTEAKSLAVKSRVRGLMKWRRSYAGYWTIMRGRISPGMKWTLARLRGCETRGYGAAGYRLDGHHDGAYQYTVSTWGRAQWWVPSRYRTGKAFNASPAHQDAVTARFFPSHRGEWACKV